MPMPTSFLKGGRFWRRSTPRVDDVEAQLDAPEAVTATGATGTGTGTETGAGAGTETQRLSADVQDVSDRSAATTPTLRSTSPPPPSAPAPTHTPAPAALSLMTGVVPDSEPNTPVVVVTPADEKRQVHFDEKAQPPAYESIVERMSREIEREQPPCTPISIQAADNANQAPTILVLFKEDVEWARVYLRDLDYKVALRRALRRHLYKWYALIIIAITLSALVSAKHTTIVNFCQPVTKQIRRWPAGWVIPIALLIVVSFPPLVGHEIIGILVGLVWGLGPGFGILCAGTFLGELATWVVFKWMCTARAAKIEKRNKLYASLTQLIREKSFTFVLILRFSAVPGHIVTAVSASAGANLLSYSAAAFLTLPKQLVLVYLGTAFGTHNQKDVIISWCATVATFLATIVAAIYIYYHMRMIIKRGGASRLPVGDIDAETGGDWASVEVHGAAGVGAGVRLEMEEAGGGRRSIDVILGPHAAAQRQLQLANSPLRASNRPRALTRTRSLPGPITEDEMRTWLTQIDTALMTTTGAAGPAMDEKPRFSGDEDAFLGATSRAENGELDPIPYSQTMLLAPPAFTVLPPDTPPVTMVPLLPDLAHEHIYPLPASARDSLALPPSTDAGAAAGTRPTSAAGSVAASPPVSGTVPVILLTQTYTPARSRADSLRGTVSLDIERPRFENELDDVGELGQLGPRASAAARGRTRGESSAALLGRPRL